jgi:CheY-like chemotaxis protein
MQPEKQILIVDDDKEDHFIMLEYFTDAGIDGGVICFLENGQMAMDYLGNVEQDSALPKLIVLDLNMPIMNGTQTLLRLKQDVRLQKIPVIIFSTSNSEQEKSKCLSYGAIDYLIKPMTYEEGRMIVKRFTDYIPNHWFKLFP